MCLPCELTLRSTDDGIRLYHWPIREIENIYMSENTWTDQVLDPDEHFLLGETDLLDIEATIKLPLSKHDTTKKWERMPWAPLSFRFNIRGIDVLYSTTYEELLCQTEVVPLKTTDSGELDIRILVDKISFEIYGNGGVISISTNVNPTADNHISYLDCTGGPIIIRNLTVKKLQSTKL